MVTKRVFAAGIVIAYLFRRRRSKKDNLPR